MGIHSALSKSLESLVRMINTSCALKVCFFYLLLCNLKRKTVDVLVTGPRGKKEFIQVDELYRAARFANFERILGFSVPSIILADLLGNTRLLERVQKVTVCDLWILIGFVCFCVSRFVAGDRPVSGNNRLVLFEDSVSYDLS